MKKKIKVGDEVMVYNEWDKPEYVGVCIGICERGVVVKKKGIFGPENVVRINRVDKLLTK